MSFILQKHQQHVVSTVIHCKAKIQEIEADIRVRAMSNSTSVEELRLLVRLREECTAVLYRYQGLSEGFKAMIGDISEAAE